MSSKNDFTFSNIRAKKLAKWISDWLEKQDDEISIASMNDFDEVHKNISEPAKEILQKTAKIVGVTQKTLAEIIFTMKFTHALVDISDNPDFLKHCRDEDFK